MNSPVSSRMVIAFVLYGVLATSAFLTLTGNIRIFILILFAALALKTWLAQAREEMESSEDSGGESGKRPEKS